MKNRITGFGRSFVSVVVTLCLLLGIFAPTIMAVTPGKYATATTESDKTINYVSIGDSMTNGYGFDGYEQGNDDEIDFLAGTGVYGEGAYPLQFEEWLKDQGYKVNHAKLALSAMRAEDFLYLLGGRNEPTDGWQNEINGYSEIADDAVLQEYFQESVKNADIITLGIGNASFGAYLLSRVTNALGVLGGELDGEDIVTLEDALIGLDDEQKQVVLDVYSNITSALYEKLPADLVEQFKLDTVLDIISYTVAGFLLNYKASIEKILELNSDVEIILVGLMNTTYGLEITGEGMDTIYIGDIMDEMFGLLNTYVAGVPALLQVGGQYPDAKFYYAEQPDPKFICQVFEELKNNGWQKVEGLSGETVREKNIDAYNSDLRGIIGGAFGVELPDITLEMIYDLDSANPTYGWASGDPTLYVMSASIYLGLEDAVAESAGENEIPLSGLMTIATDIDSVFDGFEDGFESDISNLRDSLAKYLTSTPELRGICKIYALFRVGNGMAVHPTPAGHDEIAQSVINAYSAGYTAAQKILDDVYEAYAEAYKYADANGYVDVAADAVEEAIKAILAAKNEVAGLDAGAELIAAIIAELDEAVKTLEEIKAAIEAGDLATIDGLVDTILALEDDLMAHLGAAAEVLKVAGSDALDYVVEKWNTEWKYEVKEFLDVLGEEAADFLVEVIKTYAPVLAEYLYNYLLENPEEVIEFIKTYGPAVIEFFAKYGEEFAAVFGYLVKTYGLDVVKYFIANGEEIIGALVKLVEKYGDEAWELIVVYADALGITAEIERIYGEIVDFVETEIEKLEKLLDTLKAELERLEAELKEAIGALKAEIEAKIEALKQKIAEIEKAIADLYNKISEIMTDLAAITEAVKLLIDSIIDLAEAVINGSIEAIKAAVNAVKAAVANLVKVIESCGSILRGLSEFVEMLASYIEAIADGFRFIAEMLFEIAEIIEKLADIAEGIAAKLYELAADIAELAATISEKISAAIDRFAVIVEETKAAIAAFVESVKAQIESALKADYIFDRTSSHYVALGDATVSGDAKSYIDFIANALGMNKGHYTDLTGAGLGFNAEEAIEFIRANKNAISKADLITINYNNTLVYEYMAANFIFNSIDWEPVFGREIAAQIDALADYACQIAANYIEEALGEEFGGIGAEQIVAIAESYVYAYIARMIAIHAAVAELHEIAPDALVIIVGAYNDFEGLALELEGVVIDLGEYFGLVIDALNASSFICALFSEDTIFVSADGVETQLQADKNGEVVIGDLFSIINNPQVVAPSEAGNLDIAERIFAALNLIVAEHTHEYSYKCDHICDTCGDERDVENLHTYSNSCDVDCDICGYERDDATEHKYACACDVYCDLCGAARTNAAPHSFSDWKVDREATYSVMGRKVRTCTLCGHAEYEYISVLVAGDADDGVSAGLVVGITIPSVLVLAAGGFSAYWFGFKKRSGKDLANAFKKMLAIFKK